MRSPRLGAALAALLMVAAACGAFFAGGAEEACAQANAGRGCGPCNPWVVPSPPWVIRGAAVSNVPLLQLDRVGGGTSGLRFNYGATGASGNLALGEVSGASHNGGLKMTNRQGFKFEMDNEGFGDLGYSWMFLHTSQDVADPLMIFRAQTSQTGNLLEFENVSGTNLAVVSSGGIFQAPAFRGFATTGPLFEDDDGNDLFEMEDYAADNIAVLDARQTTILIQANDSNMIQCSTASCSVAPPLAAPAGASVGGGTTVVKVGRYSATIDFASITETCSGNTITATGVAVGDACAVARDGGLINGSFFTCEVRAADAVTVNHCCLREDTACDPASQTFYATVFEY